MQVINHCLKTSSGSAGYLAEVHFTISAKREKSLDACLACTLRDVGTSQTIGQLDAGGLQRAWCNAGCDEYFEVGDRWSIFGFGGKQQCFISALDSYRTVKGAEQ